MAALPKISLKGEIPDEIKQAAAKTKWGKVLSVMPVVMTVIATMLAGLSSSEMTQAQYDRSLAAQRQSKAGDQWNFFQGKKLRSAIQQSAIDSIGLSNETHPLVEVSLREALSQGATSGALDSEAARSALQTLTARKIPKLAEPLVLPANVQAALTALEEMRPDAEREKLLSQVPSDVLDGAVRQAQQRSLAQDALLKPVGQTIDGWETQLGDKTDVATRRGFVIARRNYNAMRYDAEAQLNQTIASLLELQVQQSNLAAEHHHRRSARFFYGMLAAQLAVIVSSLAMAAQQRNLLWTIAAVAGLVAVGFALYVFIYV